MRHKASALRLAPAQVERRCTLNQTMPFMGRCVRLRGGPGDGHVCTGDEKGRP